MDITAVSEREQTPRLALWLAYLSGGFGLAMFALGGFLVPLRARELGASFDAIGLIVAAGALPPALASIPLGAAIDRFGPRRTFICAAAAAALLSVLSALVENYWWFLALQPLLGVTRSLGWAASQNYITRIGTAEQRPSLTGRFSLVTNISQMAAPIMAGGASELVGYRWALLLPAIYAAFFTGVGLLLVETRSADHESSRVAQGMGFRTATELLRVRGIQMALLLTFSRLWTMTIYSTFLPVYLVDTGFSPARVGTVMAISGLVAALTGPTAGFWSRHLSQGTTAVLCLACSAAGLLLAPHIAVVPLIYLVPALIGIGLGLSLPLLLSIITTAAPDTRGVALGLREMINQGAATAAPVAVGPLIATFGITFGFTLGGLLAGSLLVASTLLARRRGR